MAQQTATQEYKSNRERINILIEKIQEGLANLDEQQAQSPNNWAITGTSGLAIDHLLQLAHAVGVITDDQAENTEPIEWLR